MKPENLRFLTILIRHLSYVPVSRNGHNTVSKLNQNGHIKVVVLNRSYSTITQPI